MINLNLGKEFKKGDYLDVALKDEMLVLSIDGKEIGKVSGENYNHLKGRSVKGVVIEENNKGHKVKVITFADLHRHSGYSLLDGASKVEDMAELTEYVGAITDHGGMFGFLKYYKAMKKLNKQPIIGFEAYVETVQGEKKSRHLVLLAKNEKGYKNLVKLTSQSYHNFYRKPHVSLDMLKKHKEGLIVLSACLGGEIPQLLINNKYDEAKKVANIYKDIFKDDFYLEIQRHNIGQDEDIANKGLIELSKDTGIKLVATTDSHYSKKEDKKSHDVLLALQTKETLSSPTRMTFEGDGYHIHSPEEMAVKFSDLIEAVDNTLEIAEKCSKFELDLKSIYMPKFEVPSGYTEETYFEYLVLEGFKERFQKGSVDEKLYLERINREIGVINGMGYASYFLIVWDFIKYAKDNGIMVGPGRGSAAGSLVSYCLHITDLDPIPYDLLFERFLNPERISLPDIDIDFCYERREEVINYVKNKYGEEAVSSIVTFGTFAAKMGVRDVARVMDIPYAVGDKISKAIPSTPGITIKKAMSENPELMSMYNNDVAARNVIDVAMSIEGLPRHSSTHACFSKGTLVTTNNGLKKIKDVRVGDLVLTHKRRFMPVVDTVTTNTNKVYTIKSASTHFTEVTGNHPLLIREMTYKGSISENGNSSKVKAFSKSKWKNVSDIEIGKDYIGIPINKEEVIPSGYELPFDNDNFWWFIGRYVGDGWQETQNYKNKAGEISYAEEKVVISCSKNEELEIIKEVLEELSFHYWVENSKSTYKINIYEGELFDYLFSFGQYAHGKRINKDVFNLPLVLAEKFLEGYLSADGHYNKRENRYLLKTVSKELAVGVMQLISKVYKRQAAIQRREKGKDIIEGRLVNRRTQYTISFTKDKRKKERSFYEDGYIWSRISSVELREEKMKMYNLTVLDDSSYVANGMAVHNCGVVISDGPVDNYLPEFLSEDKDNEKVKVITSQVTMNEVEDLGLIKMDFLGLKTMSIIGRTIKSVNRTLGKNEKVEYLKIPHYDPYVYLEISKGQSYGLFQLESPGMRNFMSELYFDVEEGIKKIEKKYNLEGFYKVRGAGVKMEEYLGEMRVLGQELFERLIAGVSLYRPGPMDYIPNYIKGIRNPNNLSYLTPELEPILKTTYSVIVYQEQVMRIVQDLAGYSLARADLVRRAMGKKDDSVMQEEKDYFVNGKLNKDGTIDVPGCVRNGIDKEAAEEIWEQMADFSKYAFNKSHKLCGTI